LDLDIKKYYSAAKEFRKALISEDANECLSAYERIKENREWNASELTELKKQKFSLNQIKQIIANENSFESWNDLKCHLSDQIELIREQNEGYFIVGNNHFEAGDVVENDIVYLTERNSLNYAIDMEKEKLFIIENESQEQGILLTQCKETLKEDLIEPPDDNQDWLKWANRVLDQFLK
jgi:hypothetical protein